MSVLITGGAGYIGGHMVLGLLDKEEIPVVIDDMSNGVPWAVPAGVPFILGDIGDYERVAQTMRMHKVDAVIHFAARLIEPALYNLPLEYYHANSVKSRTLIQAALDCGVKHFVFSATAAVYGNPDVNPVPETARIAPITAYGSSKWMTEVMLNQVAATSDMRFAALRYFNVAGADPKGRFGQSTTKTTLLVQIAAQCALGLRDGFEMFGDDYPTSDGTCIRDYIHVTDLVEAHLLALGYLRQGGHNITCNCGYGSGYSVKQVINMVKEISGRDFDVRCGPRRAGDAIEVVANPSLIRKTLGWTPQYDDLKLIATHALRWEQKLQELYRFQNRV